MSVRVLPIDKKTDPKSLVTLFKYYRQLEDKTLKFKQKFSSIRSSTDYRENRKAIDRLSKVLEKYDIDRERYVKYCVHGIGCREVSEIAKAENIKRYGDHLKRKDQYGNIVHNFRRSARNLADMCLEHGTSPSDELSSIISRGRLAYEYLSGRLSKYFIACISNFGEIYPKLDQLNRDELGILYNVFEELRQDVHRAFLLYERKTVTPLGLTDEAIHEKTKPETTKPKEIKNESTVR